MSIFLLAVTPPSGPIDPAVVDAWARAGAVGPGFAVLLREPGTVPATMLAPEHRFADLRRRCSDADIELVMGCDFTDLDRDTAKRLEGAVAGVQLRGDPPAETLARVRGRLPGLLVGRSCHGAPQPGAEHVDYTVFAPVFPPATPSPGVTKPAAGLEALRRWTATGAWTVALGGIGPSTAAACMGAGASGLASIRSFFGEPARVAQDVAALAAAIGAHRHEETPT